MVRGLFNLPALICRCCQLTITEVNPSASRHSVSLLISKFAPNITKETSYGHTNLRIKKNL